MLSYSYHKIKHNLAWCQIVCIALKKSSIPQFLAKSSNKRFPSFIVASRNNDEKSEETADTKAFHTNKQRGGGEDENNQSNTPS